MKEFIFIGESVGLSCSMSCALRESEPTDGVIVFNRGSYFGNLRSLQRYCSTFSER